MMKIVMYALLTNFRNEKKTNKLVIKEGIFEYIMIMFHSSTQSTALSHPDLTFFPHCYLISCSINRLKDFPLK